MSLTLEQERELRKVALAVGKDPDEFLALIIGRAEGWTKKLEAAGVGYKSKMLEEGRKVAPEESFVEQFLRSAVGPLDEEKSKPAPALLGLLDRAFNALARRDSTQAAVKGLADGTKASRAKLPNADAEALAQAVARLLKPTMDPLVSQVAEIGQRIDAAEARLAASKPTDSNGAKIVKYYGPIPIFDRMPDNVMGHEEAAQKRFMEGRRNGHSSKPADFGFLWGYGRGPAQ